MEQSNISNNENEYDMGNALFGKEAQDNEGNLQENYSKVGELVGCYQDDRIEQPVVEVKEIENFVQKEV